MKQTWKRVTWMTALVLTLVLVVTAPVYALGDAMNNASVQASEEAEINEIPLNTLPAEKEILAEDTGKREENIKHYINTDGSYTAYVYSEPVHYLNEGKYEDIDNTFESKREINGHEVVENKANDFKVQFAKQAGQDKVVEINYGKYALSWGMRGERPATAVRSAFNTATRAVEMNTQAAMTVTAKKVIPANASANEQKTALPNIQSGVKYTEAFTHVDFEYELTGKKIKENIILDNMAAVSNFCFDLTVTNLEAELQEDGSVLFRDEKTDEVVLQMQAPFMVDSNGAQSTDIDVELIRTAQGYTYLMRADRTWLEDRERAYPVVIDPIVGISNNSTISTYVSSAEPTFYGSGEQNIKVGYSSYSTAQTLNRAYIQFPDLPELTAADRITEAWLQLSVSGISSASGVRVDLHQVTNSWNQYMTWSTKAAYNPVITDFLGLATGMRCNFNITSLADQWYQTGNNYGVMLKIHDETYSYVENCALFQAGNSPCLVIDYCNTKGLESYYSTHEQSAGSAGTGYINDYTGNLVFVHEDAATNGLRMPASISHIYNGYLANKPFTYQEGLCNSATYSTMRVGRGFKLNVQETVKVIFYGDSAAQARIIYTDADGTEHYMNPEAYSYISDSYFYDEDGLGISIHGNLSQQADFIMTDTAGNEKTFTMNYRGGENIDGYLTKIKDTNGNELLINYTGDKITSVVDGNGDTLTLAYDSLGMLTGITDTQNRTTSYTYDDGRLTTITYPDGKSSHYTYNDDGALQTAVDISGQKIEYLYTDSNIKRVSQVKEYGSAGGAGQEMRISYDMNETSFTDPGIDGLYDTADDITGVLQFDNEGRTVCNYSKNGSTLYGASLGEYNESAAVTGEQQKSKQNNRLLSTSTTGAAVENLLVNHSAEADGTWAQNILSGGTGSTEVVSTGAYLGQKALKVVSTSTSGRVTFRQSLALEKGKTYTFSGYVKTDGAVTSSNRGAGFFVRHYNAEGTLVVAEDNYITNAAGYERTFVTFTVPADATSGTVYLYAGLAGASGTAYFDAMQLEAGNSPSQYNLLENSSFERITDNRPTSWTGTNLQPNDLSTTDAFDGDSALKLVANSASLKGIQQDIILNATENTALNVSGWLKATSAYNNGNANAYIKVSIWNSASSTTSYAYYIYPNRSVTKWQYLSDTVLLDNQNDTLNENVYKVRIRLYYAYNANEAIYDHLQVTLASETNYKYDENGNLISTTSTPIEGAATAAYDAKGNVIKEMSPTGETAQYRYDNNNNLLGMTTNFTPAADAEYDQYGNVTESWTGRELIAYYTFDDSTLNDSSGNAHHGTNHGATFVNGKLGKALKFDGTDDWAELGLFDATDSFTVSMWVKPDSMSVAGVILGKHTATCGNQTFITARDTYLRAYAGGTNLQVGALVPNYYRHVTVTYEKVNATQTKLAIYVDGVLVGEKTVTALVGETGIGKNWCLGQDWDAGDKNTDFFKGEIDEVAFFGGVLDEEEVDYIYHTGNGKRLMARYSFDSADNFTIPDLSGNGNNATIYGAPATIIGTTLPGFLGAGKYNQSVFLDGTNDYITLPNIDLGHSFTVSMWIKQTEDKNVAFFSRNGNETDASKRNALLFASYSNNIGVTLDGEPVGWDNARFLNTWGHIAMTVERTGAAESIVSIYKDGVLQYTDSAEAIMDYTNTLPWSIGQEWDTARSDFFKGYIDEFRLYNYPLTEAQIQTLARNSGIANVTGTTLSTDDKLFTHSATDYSADGDRVESETDALGNTVHYIYDTYGNLVGVKDSLENVTMNVYNELNGLLERVYLDANGNGTYDQGEPTNAYTYTNDVLTGIDSNGADYTFTYDEFGNQTAVKVGAQQLISNVYLARNGQLDSATYGNGFTVSYEYDVLGRVTAVLYGNTRAFAYTYNNAGNVFEYTDAINNVTYTYLYDYAERPVSIKGSNGYTLSITYDAYGRVQSSTDTVDGVSTTTEPVYGDASVSGQDPGKVYGVKINGIRMTAHEYDVLSRVESTQLLLTTPFEISYTYVDSESAAEQTSALIESINNGGNTLSYTYDANGNILTEKKNGVLKLTYTYDALGQLIREDNAYLGQSITYTYDLGGNILNKKTYAYTTGTLGTATDTVNYTYGDNNWGDKLTAYDGKPITYDAIGNPLTYDGWTYTWQHGRELASLSNGTNTYSYKYNEAGIRTQNTVNGVTTKYILDGMNVLFEITGNNIISYYYDENGDLLGLRYDNADYWYVKNLQGDIIGILNNAGTQVVSYTYDTWGKLISITGTAKDTVGVANPYRYRGYRYDTETGLYYLNARYYNPEWGRFINADVIIKIGKNITKTNLFLYCGNNPVCCLDKTGCDYVYIGYPTIDQLDDVEQILQQRINELKKRSIWQRLFSFAEIIISFVPYPPVEAVDKGIAVVEFVGGGIKSLADELDAIRQAISAIRYKNKNKPNTVNFEMNIIAPGFIASWDFRIEFRELVESEYYVPYYGGFFPCQEVKVTDSYVFSYRRSGVFNEVINAFMSAGVEIDTMEITGTGCHFSFLSQCPCCYYDTFYYTTDHY